MDYLLATNPVAPHLNALKGMPVAAPARRTKAKPPQLPEVASGRMAGSIAPTPTASTSLSKLSVQLEAASAARPMPAQKPQSTPSRRCFRAVVD